MAEESPSKRPAQQDSEEDPEDGPSGSKKPRLEDTAGEAKAEEPRDPGKKQ